MAIEYQTTTYRTVESTNDNASYCWVELSTSHLPPANGLIKRIVIQGANTSASSMTTNPIYLGIWERQDDGGLISLGCSKNTVVQALNQESIWEFDGASFRGKSLLLALLSSPDEQWTNNTPFMLRSRVQTSDTDGCVILTDVGRLRVTPDITFTLDCPVLIPDEEPEATPETEVELRQIDISNYWPSVVGETDEFQQIAEAENPEFNTLQACIYRVLQDSFVHDATDYGVRRWESILGISPAAGDTLDDRKARILTYLNIKLPYTWRILKQMLTDYLDENQFVMDYINDEGKLVLHTDRISDDKLETINTLLEKVIPQNIEVVRYNQSIDIPWRDWTPGFTQVEYLESTRGQFMNIATMDWGFDAKVELDLMYTDTPHNWPMPFTAAGRIDGKLYRWDIIGLLRWDYGNDAETNYVSMRGGGSVTKNKRTILLKDREKNYQDGKLVCKNEAATWEWNYRVAPRFFGESATSYFFTGRIYSAKGWKAEVPAFNLVPAIDPTGAPCMYDLVTRQPFYNKGTGDFLYPGAESAVATTDLDDKSYAQLTATGVRRLYHVPAGCNMTKEEYAAANGFKELVEPPAPLEGYWTPEWRETDTQLILEWIETEPPAEPEPMEVTENE